MRLLLLASAMAHLVSAANSTTTSYMMQTTSIYADSTCSGPAVNVLVIENNNCSAVACSPRAFGNNTDYYKAATCYSADSNFYDPMEDLFDGHAFVEGQVYSKANCTDDSFLYRLGLVVGGCEPFTTLDNNSVSVTLGSDGSAALILYDNTECTDPPITKYALGNDTLANHLCYEGISNTGLVQYIAKYYIHENYDSSSSSSGGSDTVTKGTADSNSSSHTAAIVGGIIAGVVVVVALIIAGLIIRRKQRSTRRFETLAVMGSPTCRTIGLLAANSTTTPAVGPRCRRRHRTELGTMIQL